jgi:alpha-tubulin suppressor-like RCC1 family protein
MRLSLLAVVALLACGQPGLLVEADAGLIAVEPLDAGALYRTPMIASGLAFSCALTPLGAVACWGWNASGQLGNGTTTDSAVPVWVRGLSSPAVQLVAGASACAVLESGAVECWGAGQLTPASVPFTGPVRKVVMGGGFTCGLRTSGQVECLGTNGIGQLGDGTITPSQTPIEVHLPVGAHAFDLAASGMHACAVLEGGQVQCWGDVFDVGGSSEAPPTAGVPPTPVTLPRPAVAVGAVPGAACALLDDGRVSCWGANAEGPLGLGDRGDHSGPALVPGLTGVTELTSSRFLCASFAQGEPKCWGVMPNTDRWAAHVETPTMLPQVDEPVLSASLGDGHACVVSAQGHVWCWGDDYHGEAGTGEVTGIIATPMRAVGL